jgi:pilus assembly protein CpaB
MNTRALWMFGLALVLAGVSVFLARNWLLDEARRTTGTQVVKVQTTPVVVATTPLHFGSKIRREHLRVVEWPADAHPADSFQTVDEILDGEDERVALRGIETNEPVLRSKVSGFGGRASLSALISEGMRAATIRVNDVNGVAGFVLPGDRVDILITREQNTKSKKLINDILIQNVKVLGVDQDASENSEQPSVAKAVTLEVTPRQSQKLALAQRLGTLSLALRNVTNTAAAASRTVSEGDLRMGEVNRPKGARKAAVKRSRRSGLSSVRVVRGIESSKYTVRRESPSVRHPTGAKPRALPGLKRRSIEEEAMAPAPVGAAVRELLM